jgi:hypothetical protein
MNYFFSFPDHLKYNFENSTTFNKRNNINQVINVPVFDYYLDRLLIIIVLIFYASFVHMKKH